MQNAQATSKIFALYHLDDNYIDTIFLILKDGLRQLLLIK